ncbi:hypothetical protein [Roseibium sp.]|uniref:hypothetical protein n=1 Tax=Roseibium sp. TaxID=1936156 RepID=UPI003A984F42
MTNMPTPEHQSGGTQGIVLAQVGPAYWMLAGEDHLDNLLSGEGPYPAPVRCLCFDSVPDFEAMLDEDQNTGQLWSIHPGIIGRLKRRAELVLLNATELAAQA